MGRFESIERFDIPADRRPVRSLLRSLIAAAVVILNSVFAGGCSPFSVADFDRPTVELLSITPLTGAPMEARFRVRLRIVNPNDLALTISGMAYDISVRERKLFSGVSNQTLELAPYSEITADLEVAAGVLNSLAFLRDLMRDPPSGGLPYRLDAKLSLKGLARSIRVSREAYIDFDPTPRAT
ncbi:MAG: LEA type 2 family protein [Pseudomonadota bacterium]